MYRDVEPVALPPKENRILQKSGRYTYVCYYTRRWWDPERGRTVDDRVSVGKLTDDGEHMLPNARWAEISATLEGTEPAFAPHLIVGPWMALRVVAERTGLFEALKRFPYWRELFALVVYGICDGCAAPEHFGAWCYFNYCGLDRLVDIDALRELLSDFIEDVYARRVLLDALIDAARTLGQGAADTAVVFDVTEPRFAHLVPQLGEALVADAGTGMPLLRRNYCGSLDDLREEPDVALDVHALGYGRMVFVLGPDEATHECMDELVAVGSELCVCLPASSGVGRSVRRRLPKKGHTKTSSAMLQDSSRPVAEGISYLGHVFEGHLLCGLVQDAYVDDCDGGDIVVLSNPGMAPADVHAAASVSCHLAPEYRRLRGFFEALRRDVRTGTYDAVDQLALVALAVEEVFRYLTRDARHGDDTMRLLLSETSMLQACRGTDGRASLVTRPSQRQREIFGCLGLDEAALDDLAAEIVWPCG